MDLVNEFEKEIKELRKQKDSIEKLSEQSANLKVERDNKKQELDKIQDYKSAFYEDLSKEYAEKDSEFAQSLAHEELAKRNLKRNMRKLWIARINAAARMNDISYSKLMHGLKLANVEINRKMLSEIAICDPEGFTAIVETAKKALNA